MKLDQCQLSSLYLRILLQMILPSFITCHPPWCYSFTCTPSYIQVFIWRCHFWTAMQAGGSIFIPILVTLSTIFSFAITFNYSFPLEYILLLSSSLLCQSQLFSSSKTSSLLTIILFEMGSLQKN